MTILEKLRHGSGHAGKRWHTFGDAGDAVRHTDVWEHETFVEEQARWERSDPEYARICQDVRQARDMGEEALRRADEAKAEWDARVATQREANDDARRTLVPRIVPEPVRVHDEPADRNLASNEPTTQEVA